jgi:hypothetical protein
MVVAVVRFIRRRICKITGYILVFDTKNIHKIRISGCTVLTFACKRYSQLGSLKALYMATIHKSAEITEK